MGGSGAGNPAMKLEEGKTVTAPSVKENDLEMDQTPTSKINLGALLEDDETLSDTLKCIMDDREFLSLFLPNIDLLDLKRCKPYSRKMKRHLQTMLGCKLVEVADEDELLACMTVFLVRKKNGRGRFIQNCKRLNDLQRKPESMGLPLIKEVIEWILNQKYANQTDGVGFFYQFELARSISPYFGMRLAGIRGHMITAVMRRLPMGWKFAPRIAQQVINSVMKGLGLGWVDNMIIGAQSKEEFEDKKRELARRLQRYNIQVDKDPLEMEPLTTLEALGIQFDLAERRYRMEPKWIEKRRAVLEKAVNADWADCTYRQFFTVIGSCIWPTHVADRPLWIYPKSLDALKQLSTTVGQRRVGRQVNMGCLTING